MRDGQAEFVCLHKWGGLPLHNQFIIILYNQSVDTKLN